MLWIHFGFWAYISIVRNTFFFNTKTNERKFEISISAGEFLKTKKQTNINPNKTNKQTKKATKKITTIFTHTFTFPSLILPRFKLNQSENSDLPSELWWFPPGCLCLQKFWILPNHHHLQSYTPFQHWVPHLHRQLLFWPLQMPQVRTLGHYTDMILRNSKNIINSEISESVS